MAGLVGALLRCHLQRRDGRADRPARCRVHRLGRHFGKRTHRHDGCGRGRHADTALGAARLSARALRPIADYLAREWRFESFDELEAHLRDTHAPFGALTDAQWRHLAEHSAVRDDRGGLRFHFDPAIARRFMVPIVLDIVLWRLWERIACPVLVLRGEHSNILSAATVAEMFERGPAVRPGRVFAVEVPGCGHAPALIDNDQIALVREFIFAYQPRLEVPTSWSRTRSSAQTKPLR